MSLIVIKPGILDTVQDNGRYGYQHLGINPGGTMDRFSAQAVNFLVGNSSDEAVIEIHFPAAAFLFQQDAIIAVGGADFLPSIDGEAIPLWHPVIINRNSVLQFHGIKKGTQCYLAIKGGLDIPKWLNSFSTHTKACIGGFNGRALQKNDTLPFKPHACYAKFLSGKDFMILPWQADIKWNHFIPERISVLPGHEWSWIKESLQTDFLNNPFTITFSSDRMGYRLSGLPVHTENKTELISSAVSFGTIQLLPDGQLIVLMADHQTTGGYPRIAHVISAHLSQLAQVRPGEKIQFQVTDMATAEQLFCRQKHHLLQLQNACKFRLEEFLNA
ncbi:MAG: urea amidolyase related protein [Chitinophagaceae bacterium]|nr:urea amidolyase related protein [Chitinophagaceae bacterium]